ncbi:unnamed protein product [Adineta steineri]|uniref:CAP-Gly domain-containing protein n=1 Tax=Adineta steineri TaxID=433720 RepID=A0A814XQ53_9BILA|nr:unnamed protein product [Adineta steineri]CAF3901903.1 unnamed protein product [Adineta steineri]
MPTKIEGRPTRHDLIDDIVEASSSSSLTIPNSISSFMMDGVKTLPNRNYSSYSNIPTLFNNKSKLEQNDNSEKSSTLADELRDRLNLTLPRSNSSSTMRNNDERRKELDMVLKHLYDGKLLTQLNDDRASSDTSEHSIPKLTKGQTTSTSTMMKMDDDDDNKMNVGNMDLLAFDGDGTTLQRELQEKELDIMHLTKEIQELQLENKLLKAKVPVQYQNGHSTNNTETEALRREKDVLQNELRIQQELVAKMQSSQHQNGMVTRTSKLDEVTLHQKEALEKKLKAYEKQMRALTSDNDKLKQHFHQTDRTIAQLKKENEELQLKVTEAKKRNDELLYQEFNALRNDLKMLKQRNDELFEENRRLQHGQQRQQQNLAWRATLQQAYGNDPQQQQQQQQGSHNDTIQPSPSLKGPTTDSKRERSKIIRSDSPNMSENSDSTNYLTTVSVDRYNNRPPPAINRSIKSDTNYHQPHNTSKYGPSTTTQEEFNRTYPNSFSKSIEPQGNIRSAKAKRSVEWNEENIQQSEGPHHRDIGNYDNQHRSQRQRSPDRGTDYMSSPLGTSSPNLYQQNYGLNRSVTIPESEHHSRRSNSYNVSSKHMNNDDDMQHDDRRHRRSSIETASPKRPYAPSSITDIHVSDVVKFSRPGGKISKGTVKYIGPIPDKSDHYLGLELEDEESKHDGVYQGQRLFQCKPNKGVFVGFSKVIMAWSGK